MADKILLVDDDQALLTVFETALSTAGYSVIKAEDGKTGIEAARAGQPQFIFLDQILPDMKGNEVLKQLKADEATRNIPVAMLSNFGQQELMTEAINLGAVDYILKYQVDASDLATKVKTHLSTAMPTDMDIPLKPETPAEVKPAIDMQIPVPQPASSEIIEPPEPTPSVTPSSPVEVPVPATPVEPIKDTPPPMPEVPAQPVQPLATSNQPASTPTDTSTSKPSIGEVVPPVTTPEVQNQVSGSTNQEQPGTSQIPNS